MLKNMYTAVNIPEGSISSSSHDNDSVHANHQDTSKQNVRPPEASQPEQKITSNGNNSQSSNDISKARRWYFSNNITSMTKQGSRSGDESTRDESTLTCSTEYRPPVRVSASTGPAKWIFDTENCDPGLCHVVFGISVKGLLFDSIESIEFTVKEEGKSPLEPREFISKSGLKTMSELGTWVLAWKMHQQLWTKENYQDKRMTMEIRISEDLFSTVDSGYLKIHFMEFRDFQSGGCKDTSLTVYQPYIWSINTNYGSDLEKREATAKPKFIVHYSTSGDGTHAVTLATTEEYLFLDLWDLKHPGKLSATTGIKLIVPQRVFTVYNYNKGQTSSSDAVTPREPSDYQNCEGFKDSKGLQKHIGYGKFHITATKDKNIKNELFITCDGSLVRIYSVGVTLKWNHERTITFTQPQEGILLSRRYASKQLIRCIRGNIFVWTGDGDDIVSVWDIEHGSMVSIVHRQAQRDQWTRIGLSSDNQFMAIYRQGAITTHWISTGGLLGIFRLPEDHLKVFDLQYVLDNTQIMLDTGNTAEEFGRGRAGLVLDATDMSILGSFSIPEAHIMHHPSEGSQTLHWANGSKLYAIRPEGRIIEPYSQPNPGCNDQCKDNLSSIREQPSEFTAPSGLHFRVEICPTTATSGQSRQSSVILSMSVRDGVPRKKVVIPPFENHH
ncbi:hypothetical protein EDD21DRAFT_412900 [Dissophora ornata]|nr:hypothetical protein EDD21DRAFT_412900 [Dissophora ornata]